MKLLQKNTRLLIVCAAGALLAPELHAQGMDPNKLRKKMDEVARLMRESERLLLEITKVDRLVATQDEIVRKLADLEPPTRPGQPKDNPQGGGGQGDGNKQQELEKKQQEIQKRLSEMFSGQKQSGEAVVKGLEELLRGLPRNGGGGGNGKQQKKTKQSKRERERQKELEQRKQKEQNGKQPKDGRKQRGPKSGEKPEDKAGSSSDRAIAAWVARLPPEDVERLNRGDFSKIPARYRKLVEDYTKRLAKREARKRDG